MELIDKVKTAIEYTKKRDFIQAEKIYLELLTENPENHTVLSFLGILYYEMRNLKKSDKYLTKSYKLQESKNIIPYIGRVKYLLKDYTEALKYLELAIKENPDIELYYFALNSAAVICNYRKKNEIAQEAYKKFPFDKYILYALAESNICIGNFKEGEKYCIQLIKQYPKFPSSWGCLGLLNELLYGAEEEARNCYRKMVQLGDKILGYTNLIISYEKISSPKVPYYIKKIDKICPNTQINFLTASYYLKKKQFKKGYSYYVKKDIRSKADIDWLNKFKKPWTGGSYKDETLLIYGDQGLGDQVQHARYLPYVTNKFKKIKVMFAPPLVDIMKRSFEKYSNIEVLEISDKFPKYDKSVQLSHVLYYLNMNFNHIPSTNGYLIGNDTKIKESHDKTFNTKNLKVGICWETGGKGIRDQIHRTLSISFFDEILKLENTNFYSFQVKPKLEDYKNYKQLIDISESFKNFDDTAAALKNLDLLITVDTSVAHMAGALGIKTFLLLPYCVDWRWFNNTSTTEWYNVIKIFRQKHKSDWPNVFENVLEELKKIPKSVS